MTVQPITYRGRTVAAATGSRFLVAEALDERPASDPERTFVIFMCADAGDVLSGALPDPYTDEDARRYARACLVPAELLERAELGAERAARALRLPADELRAARAKHKVRGGVLRRLTSPVHTGAIPPVRAPRAALERPRGWHRR